MIKWGKILFFIFLFFEMVIPAVSQIDAPLADDHVAAVYDKRDTLHTDTIYVFNRSSYGAERYGTLQVSYQDTFDRDTLYFAWSKYDDVSNTFNSPFMLDTSTMSSLIDSLDAGGYKVRITDTGNLDTTFFAWVHINDMYVEVINENDTLPSGNYTCDYVQPEAILKQDTFFYYYPLSDSAEPIKLEDEATVEWTSDNTGLTIPGATRDLDPRIYDAPAEDTWFYFSAIDSFGVERKGEVFYETIHTKAEFTIKIKDIYADNFDDGSLTGSAHIKAVFINESVNGEIFEWDLGDTLGVGDQDLEFDFSEEYDTNHVYYVPGNYYVKLTSISEEGCEDELKIEDPIVVEASAIPIIPNYFSPNKDNKNDRFRIYAKSLNQFEISIYSRWGKLVYEYSGKFAEWKGWDGTIKGKGDAPADVYFYILRARGWEQSPPQKFQGKEYTGKVFLFR